MNYIRVLTVLLFLGMSTQSSAAARAWLDRDHVVLGDSITLMIESDGSPGKPDLAPLRKDFELRGVATGSQTTIVNGSMRSSMQWSVTLVPRHHGVIDVPALAVGADRTPPLRVGVDTAASTDATAPSAATPGAHSDSSDSIFIESEIQPTNAYVQQATIYTVRLYYAVALLDAALDVPSPEHGDLRQVGDDGRTSVMVHGHRYDVLERHYLLQPEQSGALHIPAPVFQGRTMGDMTGAFDDSMAASGGGIRVVGKPLDLQVRARPPMSQDPWLPARALELSVEPLPGTPTHAGEPFSVVVKISGEGVTAAQLPEISLPDVAGAQVYPEPSSTAERARDGSMQAERTRRFAVVPERAGDLRLPRLEVPWWDVVNDRAALARLALPTITVLRGTAPQHDTGNGPPTYASSPSTTSPAAITSAATARGWQIATFALAVLLLTSIWWGWRRGQIDADADAPTDAPSTRTPNRAPTLTRALAVGDPAAITQALLEAAPVAPPRNPAPRSLVEVAQRLDDASQRAAVLAFDAGRWSADGTPSAQELAQLRSAFAQPPRWIGRVSSGSAADSLPPLYPS